MEHLKLKCSQMSLSDLDVLKNTMISHYESEIINCNNNEDRDGLIGEFKSFKETISEIILSKSTDIVFNT